MRARRVQAGGLQRHEADAQATGFIGPRASFQPSFAVLHNEVVRWWTSTRERETESVPPSTTSVLWSFICPAGHCDGELLVGALDQIMLSRQKGGWRGVTRRARVFTACGS